MDWYKMRNQLAMPMRSEFQDSETQLIRIANLIEAADYSFKWEAVERMMEDAALDPRLAEVANAQLLAYIKGHSAYEGHGFQRRILTQAWLAKLLGLSGDIKYRETMNKLLQSDVPEGVKRHAREALIRLDN